MFLTMKAPALRRPDRFVLPEHGQTGVSAVIRRRGCAAASVAGICLALASMSCLAQTTLRLPTNPEDFKELLTEPKGAPCERCGVVTSIRRGVAKSGGSVAQPPAPGSRQDDGPGDMVATVPLVGRAARDYRIDLREQVAPETTHVVGVRFDDGSYGAIEVDDEPNVKLGDRVRLRDGSLERVD